MSSATFQLENTADKDFQRNQPIYGAIVVKILLNALQTPNCQMWSMSLPESALLAPTDHFATILPCSIKSFWNKFILFQIENCSYNVTFKDVSL